MSCSSKETGMSCICIFLLASPQDRLPPPLKRFSDTWKEGKCKDESSYCIYPGSGCKSLRPVEEEEATRAPSTSAISSLHLSGALPAIWGPGGGGTPLPLSPPQKLGYIWTGHVHKMAIHPPPPPPPPLKGGVRKDRAGCVFFLRFSKCRRAQYHTITVRYEESSAGYPVAERRTRKFPNNIPHGYKSHCGAMRSERWKGHTEIFFLLSGAEARGALANHQREGEEGNKWRWIFYK